MQLKKTSDDVGDLARSSQQTRDTALLRATTELFVHDLTHDLDEIRRFEDLATHFLPKVGKSDRIFVAERLAISSDAPQSVIRMLARDVIDVAAPVICRSSVLDPLDLLAVIAATGVEHHRLIARRPDLADQVKRALRLTGDAQVVSCLDEGPSTTAVAGEDAVESDGSPAVLDTDRCRPAVPKTPGDRRDPEQFLALDRKMRLRVIADFATRPPVRRYSGSAKRLDRAFRSILGAAKIVGFARTGQPDALVSAISDGLELEPDFVRACVADATGEALAVLLKALRLEEVQAQQVLLLACPAGRDTATFFPLADLYAGMEPAVAESLCETWRAAARGRKAQHEPLVAQDSARHRPAIAPANSQDSTIPAEKARRA